MNAHKICIRRGAVNHPRKAPWHDEIAEALRAGKHPNVKLFATPDSWVRAQRHREMCGPATALCLPPNESPLSLRWPPLRDLIAVIDSLSGERARELAEALIRDGAMLVYLLDSSNSARNFRAIRKRSHESRAA
ncbi:MAG: hypothetical protein P4L92_11745 [Rudaea sp.]|nr:hypothetical protein [Rudaea sp.]